MLGKGELAVCFADVSTGEVMASAPELRRSRCRSHQ